MQHRQQCQQDFSHFVALSKLHHAFLGTACCCVEKMVPPLLPKNLGLGSKDQLRMRAHVVRPLNPQQMARFPRSNPTPHLVWLLSDPAPHKLDDHHRRLTSSEARPRLVQEQRTLLQHPPSRSPNTEISAHLVILSRRLARIHFILPCNWSDLSPQHALEGALRVLTNIIFLRSQTRTSEAAPKTRPTPGHRNHRLCHAQGHFLGGSEAQHSERSFDQEYNFEDEVESD
mmetsp:Transcript_65646/g.155073  ORF Transcript_65646/g.155073 Transcript_65646/m.155073 type:complete len:229 (-) Transcript_65646:572-1258(-)